MNHEAMCFGKNVALSPSEHVGSVASSQDARPVNHGCQKDSFHRTLFPEYWKKEATLSNSLSRILLQQLHPTDESLEQLLRCDHHNKDAMISRGDVHCHKNLGTFLSSFLPSLHADSSHGSPVVARSVPKRWRKYDTTSARTLFPEYWNKEVNVFHPVAATLQQRYPNRESSLRRDRCKDALLPRDDHHKTLATLLNAVNYLPSTSLKWGDLSVGLLDDATVVDRREKSVSFCEVVDVIFYWDDDENSEYQQNLGQEMSGWMEYFTYA